MIGIEPNFSHFHHFHRKIGDNFLYGKLSPLGQKFY